MQQMLVTAENMVDERGIFELYNQNKLNET